MDCAATFGAPMQSSSSYVFVITRPNPVRDGPGQGQFEFAMVYFHAAVRSCLPFFLSIRQRVGLVPCSATCGGGPAWSHPRTWDRTPFPRLSSTQQHTSTRSSRPHCLVGIHFRGCRHRNRYCLHADTHHTSKGRKQYRGTRIQHPDPTRLLCNQRLAARPRGVYNVWGEGGETQCTAWRTALLGHDEVPTAQAHGGAVPAVSTLRVPSHN